MPSPVPQAHWGLGDEALPRKEEQKRESEQNQSQALLRNGRKSFLAGREAGACVFRTAPVLGMKQREKLHLLSPQAHLSG